jgi:soluble lytic murein transglycosylase-like protein
MRRTIGCALALAAFTCAANAQEPSRTLEVPHGVSERQGYIDIVRREATARGLPPEVAEAVAHVETGFRPDAVGAVGEIGLMQIRPATAEMLGHDGGALALFDPATNARFAVRYLATAWKLANGDLCRALMKYRAGHGAETMSPLSANYCLRAKAYLARLGSPLADGVAPDVVAIREIDGDRPLTSKRKAGPYLGWRPGRHTPADNARFWDRHEARIAALNAKIERRWKLRMAKR